MNKDSPFQRRTAGAFRALSGQVKAAVQFGDFSARMARHAVELPAPDQAESPQSCAKVSAAADSLAVFERFHNPILHRKLCRRFFGETNSEAGQLFLRLERLRCQIVGGRIFAGTQPNLRAYNQRQNPYGTAIHQALVLLLEEQACPQPMSPAELALVEPHRSTLQPLVAALLNHDCWADQSRFASLLPALLRSLTGGASEEVDLEATETNPTQILEQNTSPSSQGEEADAAFEPLALDDTVETILKTLQRNPRGDDHRQPPDPKTKPNAQRYHVYTRQYDVIASAAQLADQATLRQLRERLDQQTEPLSDLVARLANKLSRQLLSQQRRSWSFDQDEGWLDPARLTRVVTRPDLPLSYKIEHQSPFRDTVVCLLIDNSGSMRGRSILLAAMCSDILSRTLERCYVPTEILGFTTHAWKGGRSRELWQANGQPKKPGRLNDLLHIIYKTAATPYRRARTGLGLMLKDDLLKENIDGEALLWAAERLMHLPCHRKILMVISDGSPVDDSTLATNSNTYLDWHLAGVIAQIEKNPAIDLYAIGVGYDVTRYYRHAIAIPDAERLPEVLLAELGNLLSPSGRRA